MKNKVPIQERIKQAKCGGKVCPEMSIEQVVVCRKCVFVSKKKVWCCLFGKSVPKDTDFYITTKSRILLPEADFRIKQMASLSVAGDPSISKMAKSFTKAAYDHAKSGFKVRTEKDKQDCINLCEKCKFYYIHKIVGARCKQCGCKLNVKIRWATAHCPIGKW